ncbi:phage tail fiber repeat family protein [Escherichia coli 2-011-08_S4_C3]|nr:phage tail protein [Escherichia coli]KDT00542.1 phage tail fiber repeat family protein [Escherichia coli 2-011-08_S4_C1]KDT13364.1 phage tail fiber repeat family protein [Escherichia coli 2-011-08_S4_C3]MEB7668994.1 phage tail protein [Escherichia coli]HDT6601774.1 phage tail protein [Citrobacter freundii]
MAAKFFALLTNQGAAKLSNMAALGEKLEITSLAVGDGGGTSPTPNQAQTRLVNEVRRAQINSLSVDEKNDSQIIAEQIIPESVGGWWIREIGLFDADGILIAVANCPETYKATTEEGSGRTQVIRMMLTVSSTDAVTLKVDPSIVLATRQYVDNAVIEVKNYADGLMRSHEQSRNHPDATTTAKGFTQLNSSVTDDRDTQSATPKAVKIAMDNANARLAKDRNLADLPNPALARQNMQLGDSSTKNTGTTANTVAAGDDARITGSMQKSQNGADIPDVAKFLQNLRLGAGAPPIGIPFFWPSTAMPNTVMDEWSDMVFLKWNGATFSATEYPKLARIIPGLKLNDVRGEFLRIWDDGRGVDNGRGLLSFQAATSFTQYAGNYDVGSGHAIGNHDGVVDYSPGFSRFPYPGPAIGDGVNHVTVRPRNIAFNFLVRAK